MGPAPRFRIANVLTGFSQLGFCNLCRSTPVGSIETRSLPTRAHCFPRSPAAAGSLTPLPPLIRSFPRSSVAAATLT